MLLLLHALAAVTAATALAAVTAATALAAVTAALALAAVTAAAALPAVTAAVALTASAETAAEAAFICRVPGFEPEFLRPHTGVLSMCYPQTCYI